MASCRCAGSPVLRPVCLSSSRHGGLAPASPIMLLPAASARKVVRTTTTLRRESATAFQYAWQSSKPGVAFAAASGVAGQAAADEPKKDTISSYLTLMRDNFCRVSLGDSEAKTCTSDALWGGLGVTVAFLLLGMIDEYIKPSGLPFMIGSYGTISILLFGAPNAPVLHKWNVVVGHVVAAIIVLLWFQLQLPVWITRAVAMGTLVAFMLLTGSVHPPGGALILTFMDSAKMQALQWWFVLYPGLLGLLVIFPVAALTNYMKENFKFMIETPK